MVVDHFTSIGLFLVNRYGAYIYKTFHDELPTAKSCFIALLLDFTNVVFFKKYEVMFPWVGFYKHRVNIKCSNTYQINRPKAVFTIHRF